MPKQYTLFIDLLRVALDNKECLSRTPTEEEWAWLFEMAEKQSISGICFAGVKRLATQQQEPSEDQYMEWLDTAVQIQQGNERMNENTTKVVDLFRNNGFACHILKGQSMASLYGDLRLLREPGDVDVWLSGGRKKICDFSMKMLRHVEGMTYRHIHFPYWDDFEVEPHFIPGYMSNPFHSRRLMDFFQKYEPKENCPIDAPWEFNIVYILQHCFNHFLKRGIGMRQLMDYYFVLKAQNDVRCKKEDVRKTLKEIGMLKFAKAVMWFLGYVFGMDKKYMICEPDEKEGRFLLSEVLCTGNFGKHDSRYDWHIDSPLKRFLANQRWNIHLLTHYPSEVLWSPFTSIYRYFSVRIWMRAY